MADVKAYTVAIGNFTPFTTNPALFADQQRVLNLIASCDGLYGVHPEYPRGTLILFDTRAHAETARAKLNELGVITGHNICEVFIDEKDARHL
jgi:hypothetical protein